MKATFVCSNCCILLVAVCLATVPLCANSITDLPWTGPDATTISTWGTPGNGAPIYGQTSTPTAGDTVLDSVTFYINDAGTGFDFTADVFAWNGTTTTGPALFTSSLQALPSLDGNQAVTVSTGGIAVTPGDEYVAYFSTLGESGPGASDWEVFYPEDIYSGGEYVGSSDGSTFYNIGGPSVAFDLEFNDAGGSVPEPATLTLLGAGLLALGRRWKMRRG